MKETSFFHGVATWLDRLVAVGVAACIVLILAVIFILAAGCGGAAQPANVAAEVRREGGLYLVMSVHAQDDGCFLINLMGKKAEHRMSIRMRPRSNEPVPVLGETWKVVCDDAGHARLAEAVKASVP